VGLVRARREWCDRKRLPIHVLYFSVDKNSHLESPESVDAQHKGCLLFLPTRTNYVETVLLAAQTLLYHTYAITILKSKGGGVLMATKKAAAKKPAKKKK
jgi:hypothetical protein